MHNAQVGAGLSDGYVKTSDGNQYDIYAIVTADGDPQQDETEVKGDDKLITTFISNQREELTINANGINFETLSKITGSDLGSSAGGLEVALGTVSQETPVLLEVGAFSKAKDGNNVATTFKKVWHKVEIKTVKISQAGEQEFNIEMTGVAYQAETDIEGVALTTARVATLQVIYS